MSDCSPKNKAPVNYVDALKNVAGIDINNDEAFLRKKGGILYNADGSAAAVWSDGSDERPIFLENLKEKVTPAKGVLVKGQDGRIYAITPKDDGRFILTADGDSVFFEDEKTNKTTFNPEDVESFSGCSFDFAVFEACSPTGSYRLRKISRDDLCSNLETANGATTLLGCFGGGMRSIKPSAKGQMLVGLDGDWVEETADLRLKYIGAGIYVEMTGLRTINWDDYGIPPVGAAGVILAELDFFANLTGAAGGQLNMLLNGSSISTLFTGAAGGQSQERFRYSIPVAAGGSITLQATYSGTLTSATMTVTLHGFMH